MLYTEGFFAYNCLMKKVLIIGAVTADLVSLVDHLPKSDEEFRPADTRMRLSGFGWNCAKVFKSLNLPYDLVTTVGSGYYGDMICSMAKDSGIALPEQRKEIHGCTYTLVDGNGRYTTMTAEGCEYDFGSFKANPDDYDYVLLGGMEAGGEGADALLDFLQPYMDRIMFVPGNDGVLLDYDTLEEIYRLRPLVQISDTQLETVTFGEETDALKAAGILRVYTDNDILVTLKDGGTVYVKEDDRIYIREEKHNVVDLCGCEEAHAAAYLCGRLSGLSVRRAAEFANRYASRIAGIQETYLDEREYSGVKGMLADLILKEN